MTPNPFRGLPLPLTTAALSLGLVLMFAWEDSVVVSTPVTRVGRLLTLAAAVALLVEMRGPRKLWATRWRLSTGPACVLIVASVVLTGLVLVSSRTNGCNCSGGSTGLIELDIWLALTLVVALVAPDARAVLLGAAGLGCLLAGVLALAGAHAGTVEVDRRLAGTYGNANYFAATQAIGLPIAIAGLLLTHNRVHRLMAMAAAIVMVVALVLSYSRSGIVAAGAGACATVVLLAPARHRLRLLGGMIVVAGLAVVLLYPTFTRHRDNAEEAYAIALYKETDASGWSRAKTGMIGNADATMSNPARSVLRVSTSEPSGGVSLSLGSAAPSRTYRLSFEARVGPPSTPFYYGLEDNDIGAGRVIMRASDAGAWRSFELSWQPSNRALDARAYFWLGSAGTFELRAATWRASGDAPVALPTQLRGHARSLQEQINRTEREYIRSRESAARLAVRALLSHPWFGVGWERFANYSATRSGAGALASHDEYLRFGAELGFPGLAAVLLLCGAVGWATFEARGRPLGPLLAGIVVAGAIVLAFSNVLESPNISLPLATAVAIAAAVSAQRRSSSRRHA